MIFRYKLLLLLWFAYFFNQYYRQVFNVLIPVFREDLAFTDTQCGLVASLSHLALALVIPIGGYAGDRYDKFSIIILSFVIGALAMASVGFSYVFVPILFIPGYRFFR